VESVICLALCSAARRELRATSPTPIAACLGSIEDRGRRGAAVGARAHGDPGYPFLSANALNKVCRIQQPGAPPDPPPPPPPPRRAHRARLSTRARTGRYRRSATGPPPPTCGRSPGAILTKISRFREAQGSGSDPGHVLAARRQRFIACLRIGEVGRRHDDAARAFVHRTRGFLGPACRGRHPW